MARRRYAAAVVVCLLVFGAPLPAHNIWIESHEIPLVVGTYGRYQQNSGLFMWTPFDSTRQHWDLTGYPGGLWTRAGLRPPGEGRPPALDSMRLDPPDPEICEFDTLGSGSIQWCYFHKNQFGLYMDGIDFTQATYRFIGNYRPDYLVYATPMYYGAGWNTAWQWRYELFPGVFIVFTEQHQKKIVARGKVRVPMSGDYYWPCLVIRDYMTFSDNMGGSDTRWIYEWVVPGLFTGGNGVAAAMSQNGASSNFINVEYMLQMGQLSVPGWDVVPPAFSDVRVWPDTSYPGPYKVWADITDDRALGAESLFYRVNQGAWAAVGPDSSSGSRFCFTIPQVTMPAQVDYYVWARDSFCTSNNIDLWTTWPVCSPESTMVRFLATSVGLRSLPERTANGEWRMAITPNPVGSGYVTVRTQGFEDSRIQVAGLQLFDAAGRCVLARSFDLRASSFILPLDCRGLSSGVYHIRLDAGGVTATEKLVVR